MNRQIRQLMALIGLLALLLSLAPPHAASAAAASLTEDEAVKLLQYYAIVRGDPSGALHLDERLTRAEAATIFVRAVGAEEQARGLASQIPFTDAVGHWAAGEIALANALGLMRGDGNGMFRPNSEITYAEVLTVLLRIVGREPTGAWDPNRIMLTAVDLGIAPAGSQQNLPAIRGKIFWAMAMAISRVELTPGQTALQKYIDATPPVLLLNQTSASTMESEMTVSGQASGAASVLIGGRPAALNQQTGSFTGKAELQYGANRITVEASDYAGNRATASLTVVRQADVARIEIDAPSVLRAGTSQKVTIMAFDRQNRAVPADQLDAQVTGGAATFDRAASALVAGQQSGRGTLTLSSGSVRKTVSFAVTAPSASASGLAIAPINNGNAPVPGKETTVKVQVVDAAGKLVTDDYWRTVTLDDNGLAGVTVKPSSALTEAGVATFTVSSTRVGEMKLVAASNGLASAETTVQFLTSPRVVLSASAATLRADGASTAAIRATLMDENGIPRTNDTGSDIRIDLSGSGTDATFTDTSLTIRQRSSASSDSATLRAGIRTGTFQITGDYSSAHHFPLQALKLPISGDLAGVKLQVTGPANSVLPNRSATVTVRVLDAQDQLVKTGSYAFQLLVSTSNGEELVQGLPEGVSLHFPSSNLRPVDDGVRDSDPENDPLAIVGRTYQGTADLQLTYPRSGTVTITPRLLGPTDEAFHPSLGFGAAAGTSDMTKQEAEVLFVGAPAGIKLTVDSGLGNDLPGGAVNSARTVQVTAQVVDSAGTALPRYSGAITLTRAAGGDKVTRIVGTSADRISKTTGTGSVSFDVQATNTEGYDVYTASATGLSNATATVAVRKTRAVAPDVVGVWGVKENGHSPVTGYVAPDDDYLEILLGGQAPPNAGEPTYWVTATVYRNGSSTPVISKVPVDMNAGMPAIRIPRSKLTAGAQTFQVVINNGAGDSQRSADDGHSTAVVATYSNSFKLTGGLFDAATGTLMLSAAGLSATGQFEPARISIVKGEHRISLGSLNATTTITSSAVSLQSDELISLLDPDVYNGEVTIEAEDRWYATGDGSQVARGTDTPVLKPMAVITHATLDLTGTAKRLYLHGYGFDQGTLNLANVHIGGVALRPGTSSAFDQVAGKTATQVTITLSKTTLDALAALDGTVLVSADQGWLTVTSGGKSFLSAAVAGDAHRLYTRVVASSARYSPAENTLTLFGSGFSGATLDPRKLAFHPAGSATVRRLDAGARVTSVNDSSIVITLSSADATYFESASGYRAKTVFLNTDQGWLHTEQGLPAAQLPNDSVRFVVPAQ